MKFVPVLKTHLSGSQVLEKINNPHYLYRMTILQAISLLAPVMGAEITCQNLLPVVINSSKDRWVTRSFGEKSELFQGITKTLKIFRVPNIKFNVAKVLQSLIPILDQSVSSYSFCMILNLKLYILSPCYWWISSMLTLQVVEKTVKPCLVELSEDPDVDVRYYANQALQACDQMMVSS